MNTPHNSQLHKHIDSSRVLGCYQITYASNDFINTKIKDMKTLNNFKSGKERQQAQNKSAFRFKQYVFEYTVRDSNNQLIRGYLYENSGKASEAIKEVRILFPVCAGYSERTVSLVS